MIGSRLIAWSYFLMSSLAHISAFSIRCLSSPFSTISRRFGLWARVGDDIVDFSGLLIVLATLNALCRTTSVMVSLMVSMSSSFFSVSNRFISSSWNSLFFVPICLASTLHGFLVIHLFFSTSKRSLMLLIAIVWFMPMLTLLKTYVCDDVWLPRMLSISVFVTPFGPFHVHLPSERLYSSFHTFLMLPILLRCRLFRFSIRAQICSLPFSEGWFVSLFAH